MPTIYKQNNTKQPLGCVICFINSVDKLENRYSRYLGENYLDLVVKLFVQSIYNVCYHLC